MKVSNVKEWLWAKLLGTPEWDDVYWVRRVESLVGQHSGPKHKTGPLKGHSETDALAWISDLALELRAWMIENLRGRYDGNMMLAKLMARVLIAWYFGLARAKSYDANRPLTIRKEMSRRTNRYMGDLMCLMSNDELICKVWSKQKIDFPFAKGAKDGRFI